MNDQSFRAFIDLIEHDQKIRQLQTHIDSTQHELQSIEQQKQVLVHNFNDQKEKTKETRKSVDEMELTLKTLDAHEQSKKKQLDVTTDNKQYQALKKEIAQLKFEQHELEEQLLKLWNDYETAQRELKNHQECFDTNIAQLNTQEKEKRDVLDQCERDLNVLLVEREQREQSVPAEWLEKYRHMRLQTHDPVVPVLEGCCSACSYMIADQDILRLNRKALIQCRGCFRLLYSPRVWLDHMPPQAG